MSDDDRDLALEAFAESEAALLEKISDLEADLVWHREINRAAIEALYVLTRRNGHLTERLRNLVRELHMVRGYTSTGAAA